MVSNSHKIIGFNRNPRPSKNNAWVTITILFQQLSNFRLMMDGGLESAMVNLGYFLQIMLKSSSNRQYQQLGQSRCSLPLIS